MFTLDTNILIYYAADDKSVADFLFQHLRQGTRFFLPTIAVVEFLAFPKLTEAERVFFASLLPQLETAPLDLPTAFTAGTLRERYALKLGDSIIAATALQTHSTLLTRNTRDFKNVTGLPLLPL